MHELSIAMSLIELLEEEVQRRGIDKVVSIHVKIGPLSGVVGDALMSAYDLARQNTRFAESELVLEPVPIKAWCNQCEAERLVESMQKLCCSVCGSSTPDIRRGRELEVSALEIPE